MTKTKQTIQFSNFNVFAIFSGFHLKIVPFLCDILANMSMPKLNDYELLEIIGSGSYSVVHRAKHKETKLSFAIKCVAKANLSKSSTDNLLREIKLLKTLKHKHIVEMIDFRWDEKSIYIIMELCDAGNLSTYIKRHCTLPETTCKFFMKQLASAMQYMRSNNISHFDLKPQNLLLIKAPTIMLKVADFGFAQYLSLNEENTVIKGSPLYMAPEILLKHCYNPSADLWSIGVILYECIFGRAPYSSKTLDELLQKVKVKQKITISPTAAISSDCRDIMTRLLVHEPEQRISFQQFFDHPFLNLNHDASDENLGKAIQIVTKAVEEDQKKNYREAYYAYCEGLQYFVPLIAAESDANKRQHLQQQATNYMERAEEIKRSFTEAFIQQKNVKSVNGQAEASCSSSEENPVKQALKPNLNYKQLYSLFTSTPQVQHALEIGRQAELYSYEQNNSAALDRYTSALNVLVPLLKQEPSGQRREMLQKQVVEWMQEAESIKALVMAHNVTDSKTDHQHCCIQ
ncbi:serine/threonine-protein kinase ULK3 [Sitodiplosis mosellana]|uniref:serine/threonine-protein kinase ULK3 n=1 Tax=Sitodiplosis mosellana TaxID=263140 RepID=UPI002444F8B6|nr:serine/threonine-protein kinase ULK3 [Sitodiplosis mosellana]